MTGDTSKWLASIVLTVFLLGLAAPARLLFSGEEWDISLRLHPWVDYLEAPFYLAGILLATVLFALLGLGWLRLASGVGALERVGRALLGGASLFGLSPLQPVFANVVLLLLIPTLLDNRWLTTGDLRWAFTVALVILFGLALGAELALRISERRESGLLGWTREVAGVLRDQAPALAGRMAVVLMAGPLLMTATAGLREGDGAAATLDVPRFALANEGLIVALLAGALAFALWGAGRRFGAAPAAEIAPFDSAPVRRQVVAWSLVALALVSPLFAMIPAGDPLRFDIDRRMEAPSARYAFGTDEQGRDVQARLAYAWRDTLYAGLLAGFAVAGIGMLWRAVARYSRNFDSLEVIVERIPPAILFFAAWGIAVGRVDDFPSLRSVGVACGVVLVPQAMRLMRRLPATSVPAAIGSLVLLAMLLVIGWSTVIGQLGFLSPPFPSFGSMLADGRAWQATAPWMANYTIAVLIIAVALPLIALVALQRVFRFPRDLVRLRG